jgi:hypothetical protein
MGTREPQLRGAAGLMSCPGFEDESGIDFAGRGFDGRTLNAQFRHPPRCKRMELLFAKSETTEDFR